MGEGGNEVNLFLGHTIKIKRSAMFTPSPSTPRAGGWKPCGAQGCMGRLCGEHTRLHDLLLQPHEDPEGQEGDPRKYRALLV